LNSTKLIIVPLLISIIIIFSPACTDSQAPNTAEPSDIPSEIIDQADDDTSTISDQNQLPGTSGVVEIVYFHTHQRCVTCLCFEERVTYVIDNHFDDEVKSGRLVYKIISISDEANAAIVDRYHAFASQLFINKIVDNKDNITDIVDIWKWKCPSDKSGFDNKIKSLIEQSLQEIEN
jgi:hypothetical protein